MYLVLETLNIVHYVGVLVILYICIAININYKFYHQQPQYLFEALPQTHNIRQTTRIPN